MPELPDVEIMKRYLDSTSLHRKIRTVHIRDEKVIRNMAGSTLPKEMMQNP